MSPTGCVCPTPGPCPIQNRDTSVFGGVFWRVCHDEEGYFTALKEEAERNCPPAERPHIDPPLPSVPRMAMNYAKAQAVHTAHGRPKFTKEEAEARTAVCDGSDGRGVCPAFRVKDRRCAMAECGCFVDEKAAWADMHCPQQLWPGEAREGQEKSPPAVRETTPSPPAA